MGRVYGESTFGDSYFGVTKYLDGVSAPAGSATSSASGVFVIDGTANTVIATSATASAAVEVYDGLASGGGSAVGSTATAYRTRNVSATSSATATGSASLQFLSNGNGTVTASASTDSTGERIAIGTASVTATSGFDASANATYQPTLDIAGTATVTAESQRIHQGSGVSSPALVFDATGRFKYEPQEPEYEIWTEVS